MKKILVLIFTICFAGGTLGAVEINMGIEMLSGKFYYLEKTADYKKGDLWWMGADRAKVAQANDDMKFTNVAFRLNHTKPILMDGLSAGIEVGMSIPVSGYEKTWSVPAGTIDSGSAWTKDASFTAPYNIAYFYNPSSSIDMKMEMKSCLFPALAKLTYNMPGETMDVNIGVGVGGYGLLLFRETTMTQTYVEDSAPYKKGDVIENIETDYSSDLIVGGDFTAGVIYELSETVSVGVNGKVGYTMTPFKGEKDTDYYQLNWTPADETLTIIKQGVEIGSINYGGGISFNLSF